MQTHFNLVVTLRGMTFSAIILAALSAFAANPVPSKLPQLSAAKPAMLIGSCVELISKLSVLPGTNITSVKSIAAGEIKIGTNAVDKHCLVTGSMFERTGEPEGTPYAIGFEMRLPLDWNGRFWYQGNGGIDGSVKTALGALGGGPVTGALLQGFAVVSSDAGHNNRKTRGPGFGLDAQARLDYGYDTETWFKGVQKANGGDASDFVRFFRIPGMDHCRRGPATDQFDAISLLVKWVEQGQAPDRIIASVRGAGNPGGQNEDLPAEWSANRTRPLCPYPAVAIYGGSGDIEDAGSFVCR